MWEVDREVVGFYPSVRVLNVDRFPLAAYVPSMISTCNMKAAAMNRVGCAMPGDSNYDGVETADEETVSDFRNYVRSFIQKKLPRCDRAMLSRQEWLDQASYPAGRKKQLQKLLEGLKQLEPKHFRCKSFLKWESYLKPKHPRGIYSYSDELKLFLAPLAQCWDKTLFQLKWFIKGTIPREWPAMLHELFGESEVDETDFTAFESHHRGVFAQLLAEAVEHVLSPLHDPHVGIITDLIKGRNVIEFKSLKVEVDERLMSGALWTSSANGFMNLMIMSYLTGKTMFPNSTAEERVDLIDTHFIGRVEGDDGICLSRGIEQSLIDRMGIRLKFETKPDYGRANFCGITCPIGSSTISADPNKIFRKFFLLPSKYMNFRSTKQLSLLRAKAMSYKYNYGDTPVIGAMCDWVLTRTRGFNVTDFTQELNWWEQETMRRVQLSGMKAVLQKASPSTIDRLQMQECFGISEAQQELWERSFEDNRDEIVLDLHSLQNSTDSFHNENYLVCPEGTHMSGSLSRPADVTPNRRDVRRKPVSRYISCANADVE